MYRLIHNCGMPKWLKILFYIVLTITLIYWLLLGIYKILELLRFCINWVTDKNRWWIFITCIILALLVSLLMAEFVWNLHPFENFWNWILSIFNEII